jgi:D-xylono/L-arabinono-1,4-lactonase
MSNNSDVNLVCEPDCSLGECPLWNVAEQKLYFTDINNCKLWCYDPNSKEVTVFLETDYHIGGFAFNRGGSLILCADNKVLKLYKNLKIETLFEIDLESGERFNDITSDPRGRIYAGTAGGKMGTNKLFRLEKGCPPELIISGIKCSNGMTFSLDEKSFFHVNSFAFTITKYDYDRASGAIANGRVFFQADEDMGFPDGLTMDSEGCIWFASWGDSLIRRLSPEGEILQNIKIPVKNPSSVNFGGKNLNKLYVSSAKDENLHGGDIYCFNAEVSGRREWLTDF